MRRVRQFQQPQGSEPCGYGVVRAGDLVDSDRRPRASPDRRGDDADRRESDRDSTGWAANRVCRGVRSARHDSVRELLDRRSSCVCSDRWCRSLRRRVQDGRTCRQPGHPLLRRAHADPALLPGAPRAAALRDGHGHGAAVRALLRRSRSPVTACRQHCRDGDEWRAHASALMAAAPLAAVSRRQKVLKHPDFDVALAGAGCHRLQPVLAVARFETGEVQQALYEPVQAIALAEQDAVELPSPPIGRDTRTRSSERCRIVVSGVRNSWETADTKSDCNRPMRSSRAGVRVMT